MAQTQPKPIAPLTFDQYLASDRDTDVRYELVHGALIEVPPELGGAPAEPNKGLLLLGFTSLHPTYAS